MTPADLFGIIIAFLLTFGVLSYLLGDNPFYRVTIHIFVGAAAGYAAVIAYFNILYPQLVVPALSMVVLSQTLPFDKFALSLIAPGGALILGIFLLMKAAPSTRRLGGLATAFMIGVGVAVAVG